MTPIQEGHALTPTETAQSCRHGPPSHVCMCVHTHTQNKEKEAAFDDSQAKADIPEQELGAETRNTASPGSRSGFQPRLLTSVSGEPAPWGSGWVRSHAHTCSRDTAGGLHGGLAISDLGLLVGVGTRVSLWTLVRHSSSRPGLLLAPPVIEQESSHDIQASSRAHQALPTLPREPLGMLLHLHW